MNECLCSGAVYVWKDEQIKRHCSCDSYLLLDLFDWKQAQEHYGKQYSLDRRRHVRQVGHEVVGVYLLWKNERINHNVRDKILSYVCNRPLLWEEARSRDLRVPWIFRKEVRFVIMLGMWIFVLIMWK